MVWKFLCAAFLDQWSLHLVVLHLVSSYAHAWVGEEEGHFLFIVRIPDPKILRQHVS